ncbi:MAG: DUF1631 family protein [Ectothiorhodospiraceae bacterium]
MTIRDFCKGGLFLAFPDAGTHRTGALRAGQPVEVSFSDPLNGGTMSVRARVARHGESGVGVAFVQPRPDVVTILAAVADGQRQPQGETGESQPGSRLTREVTRLCREFAETFCQRVLADYAAHVVDELFERARAAGTNEEQNAYFTAFRSMRDARSDLPGKFVTAFLDRLGSPQEDRRESAATRKTADTPSTSELSLVDEQEFEDWLSRSDIVNRAETRHSAALEALNRRLTYVYGRRITEANNPLGPAAFAEALTAVLPMQGLDPRARQPVYEIFGRTVLQPLGDLLEPLNARLRERGILPDAEKERPVIRPLGAAARSEPSRPETAEPNEEPPRQPESAPSESTDQGKGVRLNWESTPPQRSTPQGTSAPPPGRRESALPAAQQVLSAHRRLQAARQAARGSGGAEAGAPAAAAAPAVAPEQVVEAVDRLPPTAEGSSRELMSRLLQGLPQGTAANALPAEQRETVEVIEDWFGDLEEDALNTEFLRDWSGRLSLLALRVQLKDGGFLKSEPQPIHDLLNQLDRAGLALMSLTGQERGELQKQMGELLGSALNQARDNPEAIADAAQQLEQLSERPLRSRAAKMQKVLQQCEGTQKLERAKRLVGQELDKRLARRKVPTLLIEFIDLAWRNLLVLVNLRAGTQSENWRRSLGVIDRLLVAMGTDNSRARPIPEPDRLFQWIQEQLKSFARLTPDVQDRLDRIRDHVATVCSQGRASRPLAMQQAPRYAQDQDDAAASIAPRWLGQAKLLKVGDWVYFAGKSGAPEPLRLQWISEDGSRFVFVNRAGHKDRDLTRVELAQQLEAAAAGLAENLDEPLTERQWQKKLREMHDQLVQHATHDELTGALNRKALLRELERLPTGADAQRRWHALLYFSLDGFKVVNSNLGQDAGDEVLKNLAKQLETAVEKGGVVGRVGGDEFAVLLRDVSATEAAVFADRQCKDIHEHRFASEDSTISITASVGVVPFTMQGRTPSGLLQDADEACLTAKHEGGNRTHVVRADDEELQRLRTSMAQAARVDAALEQNRLRLSCQRIQPITGAEDAKPFYEILVAIRGTGDEIIPPDEFIPAAERFGRMTAVDRWVIRNVFQWCKDHPGALHGIDGFTINLSGPTLNDDKLAPYVREELARTGLPGEKFCFEVTETAAVQNLARAADLIHAVKELGCRFSLDDFGTGLSSYSYLKNLPVDYLKIDGQFIREIDQDEADHAMVRSINELGHFLGKRTIAEYVENDRILYQLRDIGLDFAQGYGVERPQLLDNLQSLAS